MPSNNKAEKCVACDKSAPLPALICFECSGGKDMDGDEQQTYYCTTRCRDADQNDHKSICKKANARKQIHDAGETLQRVFEYFRHSAFDTKIAKVENVGGITYMYAGKYTKQDGLFFRSPMTITSDWKAVRAMLSFCACSDVWQLYYEFGKKLLTGLNAQIEEVALRVDASLCKVKRVHADGRVEPDILSHVVLSVQLEDGEVFILDIAGGQFGQYCPVMPVVDFMAAYKVPKILDIDKFGTLTGRSYQGLLKLLRDPNSEAQGMVFQTCMAKVFDDEISAWEEEQSSTLNKILDARCGQFEAKHEELRERYQEAMGAAYNSLAGTHPISVVLKALKVPKRYTSADDQYANLTISDQPKIPGLSVMYRIWGLQQKERLQTENPLKWTTEMEPLLAKGQRIVVSLVEKHARAAQEQEENGWQNANEEDKFDQDLTIDGRHFQGLDAEFVEQPTIAPRHVSTDEAREDFNYYGVSGTGKVAMLAGMPPDLAEFAKQFANVWQV